MALFVFKLMATALIMTIVIEITIALIIGIRSKIDLINVLLVNILTNPLVNSIILFVTLRYNGNIRIITIAFMEAFALICEGFIYSKYLKYKKFNPYIVSLILNASSFFLGNILNNIIY